MLLNEHEAAASADPVILAKSRNQQSLVVFVVFCLYTLFSLITSGALRSVPVELGTFPGGTYIYRYTQRDYAASNSLLESVGDDLGFKNTFHTYNETLYTLYLDDPAIIRRGRNQRFAAGFLARSTDSRASERQRRLLELNDHIQPATEAEIHDFPAWKLWKRLPYRKQKLPAVPAAVVKFPNNNGFVSSLVTAWKVIPQLRAFAAAHGVTPVKEAIVVLSTCHIRDNYCLFYTPLAQSHKFMLGQEPMAVYQRTMPSSSLVQNVGRGVVRTWSKLMPSFSKVLPWSTTEKDEL